MALWQIRNGEGKSLLEKVVSTRDNCYPSPNTELSLYGYSHVVEFVIDEIKNNKKIAVAGDYDCDGVAAAVIMESFLKRIGADVIVRLPERHEGFGLSIDQVKEFHEKGIELIITVDNGTSAYEAINAAHELGIEVVVTDHHEAEKKPATKYIINPKLGDGYQDYSGAGLAYLFCCEIAKSLGVAKPEDLVDLAGLATVVDVCPLTEDNHVLARKGMLEMRVNPRNGIRALSQVAKTKVIDGYAMGWQLGPRINSAGRIDSPLVAYELLTADTVREALNIALKLDSLNKKRQELVEEAFQKCMSVYNNQTFTMFLTPFHQGIVGVVAGRLAEKLCRPVLVGSLKDGIITASGRTVGEFDLLQALTECQEITSGFIKMGGHKKAAGVTFAEERAGEIALTLDNLAKKNLKLKDMYKKINIDCVIDEDVKAREVAELDRLEPFGEGNPEPVFMLSGDVKIVKKGDKWTLAQINGIKFFMPDGMEIAEGYTHLAANLRISDYDGAVVANVLDFKKKSINREYLVREYIALKQGGSLSEPASLIFDELNIKRTSKNIKNVDLMESETFLKHGII